MKLPILIVTLSALATTALAQRDGKRSPAVAAIENGDLAAFKKAVNEQSHQSDEYGMWSFDGVEESNLIVSTAIQGRWKMLAHLYSVGSPKQPERLGEFAAKTPAGERLIDLFLSNHPDASGETGTRLLCSLIQRFDISGREKPHPLVTKLVEGGVPLESGRYSALVAAVEFRDLVLAKYLKGEGAKVWKKSKWFLSSAEAMMALRETEFNAAGVAAMSWSFEILEVLIPVVKGTALEEMDRFRKAYPPQPDSPLLGTYELTFSEVDDGEPVPFGLQIRLLPDSTAIVPMTGFFDAAAWKKDRDEIELHPISVDGPAGGDAATILKLTDEPGVLEVRKFCGSAVRGATAHLVGSSESDEFSVPADSPAIGEWRGTFDDGSGAKISVHFEFRADGKGRMIADELEMDTVWKHLKSGNQIESYVVTGGQVRRSSAMKMTISEDGKQLIADDDERTVFVRKN